MSAPTQFATNVLTQTAVLNNEIVINQMHYEQPGGFLPNYSILTRQHAQGVPTVEYAPLCHRLNAREETATQWLNLQAAV